MIMRYSWSSLPGYLSKLKREEFIDYSLVLSEYGGDNDRARKAYCKALYGDMAAGIKIHDKILVQSILGGDEFIEWVTKEFLKGKKDRGAAITKENPHLPCKRCYTQSYRA